MKTNIPRLMIRWLDEMWKWPCEIAKIRHQTGVFPGDQTPKMIENSPRIDQIRTMKNETLSKYAKDAMGLNVNRNFAKTGMIK